MPRENINCKEILRLHGKRMSQDAIASVVHASKKSVSNVLKSAKNLSLGYDDVRDMTDGDVHALLFPEQEKAKLSHCYPELKSLHEALAVPGTTLKDEWHRFGAACAREGRGAVGYAAFCNAYNAYIRERGIPSHASYKYGETLLCTWAVCGLPIRGTKMTAYVFLGVLPAGGCVYTEVTDLKDEDTFIRCIIHMLESLGGSVRAIGIMHVREPGARRLNPQEVVVSERTMGLRRHYGTDVRPVPPDGYMDSLSRSLTEAVGAVDGMAIQTVVMRVERWTSTINRREPEAGYRERGYLTELPEMAYDVATVHKKGLTVQNNSHVKYRGNYYSVPHELRGKTVTLQYTDKLVELLSGDVIVAVHDRFPPFCTHSYATDGGHMPPPDKRPYMDRKRMLSIASRMGTDVRAVADGMFGRVEYEEQAYNTVQSLLQLGKQFGPTGLNDACRAALKTRKVPGYKYISELLRNG